MTLAGRAERQHLTAITPPREPPLLARLLRRVRDTGRALLSGLRRRVLTAAKLTTATRSPGRWPT